MEQTIESYIRAQNINTQRVIRPLYDDYLKFLAKKFGRFSYQNVAKANTKDAFHFFDYIRSRKGIPSRVDKSDIKAGSATIYVKMRLMRKLYSVLQAEGLVTSNIFHTHLIKLPHKEARMKRKTEVVPFSTVKMLLALPDNTLRNNQVRCLMALLLAGGLRLSEALNLTLADIKISDYDTRYLELRQTKSGSPQLQSLPKWINKYLAKQITQRSLEGAISSDKLFITYSIAGTILRQEYLFRNAARHLKHYFRAIELPNCSSHSLRKTSIQKLVHQGYDSIKVREFSRHANLMATQKYIDEARCVESNVARKLNFDV